jgi:hypothetical protein
MHIRLEGQVVDLQTPAASAGPSFGYALIVGWRRELKAAQTTHGYSNDHHEARSQHVRPRARPPKFDDWPPLQALGVSGWRAICASRAILAARGESQSRALDSVIVGLMAHRRTIAEHRTGAETLA